MNRPSFSWSVASLLLLFGCGTSFSAGSSDSGAEASGFDASVDAGVDGKPGDSAGGPDTSQGEAAAGDSCGAVPSCPQLGWQCGVGQDACGRSVDCQSCTRPNETCDPSHQCRCHPLGCADFHADCGSVPDGCGNTLQCGVCEAGAICGGGGTLQCGTGPCVPTTCQSQGAQCGTIDDGCGNIVQCTDTCTPPQTCGGSGNGNKCGCTPKTCTDLGWQCGAGGDGCGGTINCGGCDAGSCDSNSHSCLCTPQTTCKSAQYGCGSFVDSCSAIETCGPAPTPEASLPTQCTGARTHLYTCCPSTVGAGGTGGLDAGTLDAGTSCTGGPTPPEPGWDCVVFGTSQPAQSWCCTQ